MKSMRSRAWATALVFVASFGCAERTRSTAEVTDTNTNWLKACESDATCGELACLCGVCTVTCEATRECTHFNANARCDTPPNDACSVPLTCGLPPRESTQDQSCAECDTGANESTSDVESTAPSTDVERGDASVTVPPDAANTTTRDNTATNDTGATSATDGMTTSGESGDVPTNDTSAGTDATTSGETDACAQAVVDAPCTGEGTICGAPCTNECQFCNRLICSGGSWTWQEVFPAPCISCGEALQCNTLTTYCHVDAATTYSCEPLPGDCAPNGSCECLEAQLDGVCTADGAGLTLATGRVEQCGCDVWLTNSDWCDELPDGGPIEWVCEPTTELYDLLNTECAVVPSGAARWCCPTSFAPACE